MGKKQIKNVTPFIKKKKVGISLLILFILSRIPFINANDVLFDSKEYLNLFKNPNFYYAVTSGHNPIHEIYIMLFWPIFHLASYFYNDPAYVVIFAQILFATITVYYFYKVITFISNKNIGLISATIMSLTPLFWITNVTITVETSYLFFFFTSLYSLTKYLSENRKVYFILSIIFLNIAFLTYSAVLLWIPLYLLIVFLKKKNDLFKTFIITFLTLSFSLAARILIFSIILNINPLLTLTSLYLGNITQVSVISSNKFLIFLRNFIPVLRNYTSLVVILGFLSLLVCYIKNKMFFFIGLLWLLPIVYINQWWDSVLMGRYSIIAGFGFAFLTGYLVNKYRFLAPVVIFYLLFVSLPALNLLRAPVPYMREEAFVKTLPKDSLFIESHFALPQLDNCCQIEILGVNRQDVGNEKLEKEINLYLKNKKTVFISSAAISDPYGLYTGPYLHPLALSYTNKFELESLLTQYTWEKFHVIDEKDNLIIYKITGHGKSKYPEVMNMKNHYRRLDYYDPISKVGSSIYNKFKD